ncbi:MAG: hypothetical protein JNM56_26795 [Planctomycetia bacterium]|nr:hypothetical protein [Planctomycetia bacterium]
MKPRTAAAEDQRRQWADQVLVVLREAIDRAWKEPEVQLQDGVFEPLRGRADFQRLLRELQE